MPPAANGTSRAAAKAFVRHWIDVLNYAGPTGDPDSLRSVSHANCTACMGIAGFIEEVHADGGSIAGAGWRVLEMKVVSIAPQKSAVIDVVTDVRAQQVRPSSNAEVESFPGGRRLKTFWLTKRGRGWVVERLDQPR